MTNQKELAGEKREKRPKITITRFEVMLVFNDGKTTGEKPDFNGNLPMVPLMPAPRRVTIEEFEADMRALKFGASS
jgi:hypothetical protein